MFWQRVITASLTIALLLAGPVPWVIAAAMPADTNGDNQVDVLDLQRAIAALMSPNAKAQLADVNNDGAVDILDVQRILSQTSETSAPVPPEQEHPAPTAVPILGTPQPMLANLNELRLALALPPQPLLARPLPVDTDTVPPPSEYRLTCGLSPHGPPSLQAEQPRLHAAQAA
jgi:hypothetical protein